MRLVLTRPLDDSQRSAAALTQMGRRVLICPVLRIILHSAAAIPESNYQALAITSANGSHALIGNPALPHLSHLPAFTVGNQSAEAAREVGFINAEATGGDVNALAARILATCCPASGPILYLSGRDTAGDLEDALSERGFEVVRIVLYEAVPTRALENATAAALANGEVDGVLLYSRRSARIWRSLIESSGLAAATRTVPHYCLSAKVAAAIAPDYLTQVAERSDEPSLFALLDRSR